MMNIIMINAQTTMFEQNGNLTYSTGIAAGNIIGLEGSIVNPSTLLSFDAANTPYTKIAASYAHISNQGQNYAYYAAIDNTANSILTFPLTPPMPIYTVPANQHRFFDYYTAGSGNNPNDQRFLSIKPSDPAIANSTLMAGKSGDKGFIQEMTGVHAVSFVKEIIPSFANPGDNIYVTDALFLDDPNGDKYYGVGFILQACDALPQGFIFKYDSPTNNIQFKIMPNAKPEKIVQVNNGDFVITGALYIPNVLNSKGLVVQIDRGMNILFDLSIRGTTANTLANGPLSSNYGYGYDIHATGAVMDGGNNFLYVSFDYGYNDYNAGLMVYDYGSSTANFYAYWTSLNQTHNIEYKAPYLYLSGTYERYSPPPGGFPFLLKGQVPYMQKIDPNAGFASDVTVYNIGNQYYDIDKSTTNYQCFYNFDPAGTWSSIYPPTTPLFHTPNFLYVDGGSIVHGINSPVKDKPHSSWGGEFNMEFVDRSNCMFLNDNLGTPEDITQYFEIAEMIEINDETGTIANLAYTMYNSAPTGSDENCQDDWTNRHATAMGTGDDFKKNPEIDIAIPKARLGKFRLSDAGMTVYPNLVNQNEAIHIDGMESDTKVQILSLEGKVIKNDLLITKGNHSAQLNQNLGSGMYIINLTNLNSLQTSSHKILVK